MPFCPDPARRARRVVLLLEDQPADQTGVPPPYRTGQSTTDQRSAANSASHARCAAKPASTVSREGGAVAGTCPASQAAGLCAEGLILLGEAEIHRRPSFPNKCLVG